MLQMLGGKTSKNADKVLEVFILYSNIAGCIHLHEAVVNCQSVAIQVSCISVKKYSGLTFLLIFVFLLY